MLANAYLPGIVAIFGAAASLLLAIIVELPILKVIWRRPLLRVAGWALLANLVSAAVGMVPVINNAGPGVTADPWEVSQQRPWTYATYVGMLLALTLISEGIVYFALNRRTQKPIARPKLVSGLLVCNLASYSVLVGLVLWAQRQDDSPVQLLKDTTWLGPCEERLWFVEPDSHHLCSIRLDGTDRRTELTEALGRFDAGVADASFYALLPGRQSIVFLSQQRDWRVHDFAGTRSLAITTEPNGRGTNVADAFPRVLEALARSEDSGQVWSNTNPRLRDPVIMSDEAGGYRAKTLVAGGGGSGFGLSIEGPDRKIEFKIPAGPAYLVCSEPAILPDRKLVVFRCSAWIMVMDIQTGRVGRLVQGDSIVAMAPVFSWKAE